MEFKEVHNKNLDVKKVKMKCDGILCDNKGKQPPYPLLNKSGFCIWINGASGSGKTNLLMNIICKKNQNQNKTSYRGCFDDVIFVSPSAHTLPKNNELSKLDDSKKFTTLNSEVFDKIEELNDDYQDSDEDKHMLLVLDDVAMYLRKNKKLEKKIGNLLKNRRHYNLSCILITQRLKDAGPDIRSNVNMFITFYPSNMMELLEIIKENFLLPKNEAINLLEFVFKDRYDFLVIDKSKRKGNQNIYFRNWNEIEINDKNKMSSNNIEDGEQKHIEK